MTVEALTAASERRDILASYLTNSPGARSRRGEAEVAWQEIELLHARFGDSGTDATHRGSPAAWLEEVQPATVAVKARPVILSQKT